MIESTPVCGVAIKNEITAPLEAPPLYRAIAVGITPQEHKGSGMPNNVAYKTEAQLFLDKYLANKCCGTNACKIPAKRNPNNR